jgi:hypothetical protein
LYNYSSKKLHGEEKILSLFIYAIEWKPIHLDHRFHSQTSGPYVFQSHAARQSGSIGAINPPVFAVSSPLGGVNPAR